MTFDPRRYLEQLVIDRESPTEIRCICPVCAGNNLTINKDSGAYKCWNGCKIEDIRNAIAPFNLLKVTRPKSDRTWIYNNRDGDPIICTRRIDDGQGKRRIWQEYLINGKWEAKSTKQTEALRKAARRAVMPYNFVALKDAIAKGKPIFWVEGEPCVVALESIGLVATTSIGGSDGYRTYGRYAQALKGAKLIVCPDRDQPGSKYADEVAKDNPNAQWLYAFPDSALWDALPKDGGFDVSDWIHVLKIEGLSTDEVAEYILASVESRRKRMIIAPWDTPEYTNPVGQTETEPEPSNKSRLDILAGEIEQAANTVLAHFGSAADPRDRIYAQGNSQGHTLVRVLKTVIGIESRYLHVSKDNDVLDPVIPESLQWEINRAFEIFRWIEKDGVPVEKRVDCPATLPKQILAMGRWPQLPILRGLSYTPLLTKTGEVITQPGYHEGTGYLLQFDSADYNIKEEPTKQDAIAALEILKDLLSEFCFKSEVDRSSALSLLLTTVSRNLYSLAPLHAVNAHQPGTGKGTLINLACILATGNKEAGAAPFTDNEEEMSKKVLSTLLSGTPIVNIDNVDRRLGGGTLERVLTTEFYKDRILGVSKNAVCSTQVLWTANGNNLQFTADMTRRTVLIELDAGMESPETRTFSRDIEAYALENRGLLVSAALTIPQAYLMASSPVPIDEDRNPINPTPLGSFGGWDAVVRRSLIWLGEPDPVQSQATIRDGDDSRIALATLLEAWHSQLGGAAYQAREIVQMAIASDSDFKHAILEVCLDRQGQPSIKSFGYYLRRVTGVVANGYRLVRGQRLTAGFPWKVEQVQSNQKVNGLEISTSSTLQNTEILNGKRIDDHIDRNPIYINAAACPTQAQLIDVDAKSSALHLHGCKNPVQRELQPLIIAGYVDDVDIPSHYKSNGHQSEVLDVF
jgi:putative DNA primase/helicase